jgi:hypothetical protein
MYEYSTWCNKCLSRSDPSWRCDGGRIGDIYPQQAEPTTLCMDIATPLISRRCHALMGIGDDLQVAFGNAPHIVRRRSGELHQKPHRCHRAGPASQLIARIPTHVSTTWTFRNFTTAGRLPLHDNLLTYTSVLFLKD